MSSRAAPHSSRASLGLRRVVFAVVVAICVAAIVQCRSATDAAPSPREVMPFVSMPKSPPAPVAGAPYVAYTDLVAGAIKGGVGLGGTRGVGAKPIGSTARAGSAGALGRGSTGGARAGATGSAAGRGAAGRAGAKGAAGTGGSRAAGQGAAGSRAGGRGAAGAGGKKNKDDKPLQHERLDSIAETSEWIDDEGAAPGVID